MTMEQEVRFSTLLLSRKVRAWGGLFEYFTRFYLDRRVLEENEIPQGEGFRLFISHQKWIDKEHDNGVGKFSLMASIRFSVHPCLIIKSHAYSRSSLIVMLWLRANFPQTYLLIDYKKIQFSTCYHWRRVGWEITVLFNLMWCVGIVQQGFVADNDSVYTLPTDV